MIVTNKDSYIHGNTVLQPEYVPYEEERRYEEEAKKERLKKLRKAKKRLKKKVKVIRNISLSFIIGIIFVGRYCIIYNMQMELNLVKTNISELNKENDNLKVELVKYNNLQYIEETATNKLQMVPADKGAAIYANLDKENVKITEKKVQDKIEKENLWSKLKKIIF
ncbi:septum formation initiator family protein [Clostridium thailandense]|uniref:septum formation initiator family protein n=1 Tax=Clostridium thailandense TaxID=2794346 RepID=UPI0039898C00